MTHWRLLQDPPARAAWNMSVNEALLECLTPGAAPILRLYRWSRHSLSLGYHQLDENWLERERHHSFDIARRASGGVVHAAT